MEKYGFERSAFGGPVRPSCPSARKKSTLLEQINAPARIISTPARETSDLLEQMNTPARKISDLLEEKNTSARKRRREGVHIFRSKTRKLERSACDESEVWKDLGEAEEKTDICGGSFQNLAVASSEARNYKKRREDDSMANLEQIMDNGKTCVHSHLSPAEEKEKEEEEEKKKKKEEEEEKVQAVHERKSVKADEEPEIGLNRFHILSTAITEHLKFELYLVQNL